MAATYGGVTYANGSVPAGILAPLDDQPYAQLRTDAADAWNRARRAVIREAGVMLTVRGWNRTLAEQEKFFLERYRLQASGDGPYDDVRWWNGRRYVRLTAAAAAIPGTSNHGWGLAVDVVDYGNVGQFDYPRRVRTFPILARHGWTDTEGRGNIQEPWHLVYDPTRDTHPTPAVPVPALQGDDHVILYLKGDKAPSVYAFDTAVGDRRAVDLPEWNVITKAGLPTTTVAQADLDAIPKRPGSR